MDIAEDGQAIRQSVLDRYDHPPRHGGMRYHGEPARDDWPVRMAEPREPKGCYEACEMGESLTICGDVVIPTGRTCR